MREKEEAAGVASDGGDGTPDGRAQESLQCSALDTAPSTACAHRFRRPSADGVLLICESCGRIVGALTHDGELEIGRLAAIWGELGRDGSVDYTRRQRARPGLRVVKRPAPVEQRPSRARTVSLV